MSRNELHAFFLQLLKKVRPADIARATGYTPGAISGVKNGNYTGDDTLVLQAIFAIYGRWHCPAGEMEVGLEECRAEMARPYSAGRIKQWAICQKCDRRNGGKS